MGTGLGSDGSPADDGKRSVAQDVAYGRIIELGGVQGRVVTGLDAGWRAGG